MHSPKFVKGGFDFRIDVKLSSELVHLKLPLFHDVELVLPEQRLDPERRCEVGATLSWRVAVPTAVTAAAVAAVGAAFVATASD